MKQTYPRSFCQIGSLRVAATMLNVLSVACCSAGGAFEDLQSMSKGTFSPDLVRVALLLLDVIVA